MVIRIAARVFIQASAYERESKKEIMEREIDLKEISDGRSHELIGYKVKADSGACKELFCLHSLSGDGDPLFYWIPKVIFTG